MRKSPCNLTSTFILSALFVSSFVSIYDAATKPQLPNSFDSLLRYIPDQTGQSRKKQSSIEIYASPMERKGNSPDDDSVARATESETSYQ